METTKEVYTMDNIGDFCAERATGRMVEIDEELFMYFLEVLPPVHMAYMAHFADGTQRWVHFGFAEGYERVTAFWRAGAEDTRYFARLTKEMNPRV